MIPGLRYVPDYLDPATHDALLAAVDEGPWREVGERRMQIYGYSYDLRKGGAYRVEDLPCRSVSARAASWSSRPSRAFAKSTSLNP